MHHIGTPSSRPPHQSSLWGKFYGFSQHSYVDIRLIFHSLLGRSGTFHIQKLAPALQINNYIFKWIY